MSQLIYPTLPGLAFPVGKTPVWRTKKTESASGREFRAALTSYPQWKYTLQYEFLRDSGTSELKNLVGFFNQVRGDFDSFLFTDPDDNSVTAQPFGTGDGGTSAFQLLRTFGGFLEPVYDLNGAPSIYVGGVLKTAGTDYTISASGVVTFTSAPANGAALTWTGSYYWRCKFLNSHVDVQKFMQALWQAGKVEFQTVKP